MHTSDIVVCVCLAVALISGNIALAFHDIKRYKPAATFLVLCFVALGATFVVLFLAGDKELNISPTVTGDQPLSLVIHYGPTSRLLTMGPTSNRHARNIMQSAATKHADRLIQDQEVIYKELNEGLRPFGLRVSYIEVTTKYKRRYPPE